ncbi:unnamed protein product, partial [Polarella glacialis]
SRVRTSPLSLQTGFKVGSTVSTSVSSKFETSRLRPGAGSHRPNGLLHSKDEDEISTAATPHDLHPQEEAEEDDVGAGRYLIKAATSSPHSASASSPNSAGQQPECAPWARARTRSGSNSVTVGGWRSGGSPGVDVDIPMLPFGHGSRPNEATSAFAPQTTPSAFSPTKRGGVSDADHLWSGARRSFSPFAAERQQNPPSLSSQPRPLNQAFGASAPAPTPLPPEVAPAMEGSFSPRGVHSWQRAAWLGRDAHAARNMPIVASPQGGRRPW